MKRPPLVLVSFFKFFSSNTGLVSDGSVPWSGLTQCYEVRCGLHRLFQRAHEFMADQSDAISTPKSPVAMKSWAAAMHVLQMRCTRNCRGAPGKAWSSQETTGAKRKQNGTRHRIGCETGKRKSHPWPHFSSVQELISAHHHLHACPSLRVILMPKKQWEMLTSLAHMINFPVLNRHVEYCGKVSFELITTP